MISKKIGNGNVLGAWQMENAKAKGMAIGARTQGDGITEAVVMLLSDNDGGVHLVINQDKLKSIGGEIHLKDYHDPYIACGIVGE